MAGVTALAVAPATAHAGPEPTVGFAVPGGALAASVVLVGEQAGVTIGIDDPALGAIRVPALRGRMTATTALQRLVAGTAAEVRRVDVRTFRIGRRPPPPTPVRTPVTEQPVAIEEPEIVVVGSKRATPLADYPGMALVLDVGRLRFAAATHGSDALVEQEPALSSTHLGPGRDKLFIRGVADSSFTGPTQATVGEYLGEARLNYSAPDPDLALYDIKRIEVLEGPQGTLYGAGSLGGIVRLEPNAPVFGDWSLALGAGWLSTARGADGSDLAGIANLPLGGSAALRVVAYRSVEGGYIDDPVRRRPDLNRVLTDGARATLRLRPAQGWTVDVGAVVQDIDSHDGQYAERSLGPLQRSEAVAQPFDNDYRLGSVIVRHDAGALSMVSSTSVVSHDLDTIFDATLGGTQPIAFTQREHILLISNETRLARKGGKLSWVAGVELLHGDDTSRRALGLAADPPSLPGTRNVVNEAAAYGEVTVSVTPRLALTGGGRLDYTRLVGDTLARPNTGEEPHRQHLAVLPSAGALWSVASGLKLFARYQTGVRPGGLTADGGTTNRFESDSLRTAEVGLRYGDPDDRFSASGSVSAARWRDIQADLITGTGLPSVANVGSGTIQAAELSVQWRPASRLTLQGAVFVNDSDLDRPAPGYGGEKHASLPDIPSLSGRVGARYAWQLGGHDVTFDAAANYVGRSRLGVGPVLDIRQGGYWATSAGLDLTTGTLTWSLDATNLLDARSNTFALGNPFTVASGEQVTPQRPRTVRLGVRFAL